VPEQALAELLRGKGAHVDPLACVEDLSVEMATRHLDGFPHSIAELVFHMYYWMNYELRRIRGESPKYPAHNAESFPTATSPSNSEEWDQLRRDLSWFLAEYAKLAKSSTHEMQCEIQSVQEGDKKVSGTLESVLWQMVAHNSYHLGQIALIRRVMGAWPPRAGRDTW
jgi:uncharacterized damage-inducible protein DinB